MAEGPESTTTVATEPAVQAAPAPASPTPTPDPKPEAPAAEAAAPPKPKAATEDEVYDQAVAKLLSGDEPATNGKVTPTGLSDEHRQLLSRQHMTPEMIEGWSDEQRVAYFENAAKREADTTKSYKDVKGKLEKLTEATSAYLEQNPPSAGGRQEAPATATSEGKASGAAAATTQTTGKPPESFAEQARSVVEGLTNVFGDEMKPLGTILEAVDHQVRELQDQAATVPLMEGMITQMAVQLGINNLVGDYPSLSTAGAKKQVLERFEKDWANSPHRTDEKLPYLDRVHSAISDAAKAVFGSVTESAAQVSLAKTTKERLLGQPQTATSGRARETPKSEDDVYEEAFKKHLAPSFRV